jgi:hypothetical protein
VVRREGVKELERHDPARHVAGRRREESEPRTWTTIAE